MVRRDRELGDEFQPRLDFAFALKKFFIARGGEPDSAELILLILEEALTWGAIQIQDAEYKRELSNPDIIVGESDTSSLTQDSSMIEGEKRYRPRGALTKEIRDLISDLLWQFSSRLSETRNVLLKLDAYPKEIGGLREIRREAVEDGAFTPLARPVTEKDIPWKKVAMRKYPDYFPLVRDANRVSDSQRLADARKRIHDLVHENARKGIKLSKLAKQLKAARRRASRR